MTTATCPALALRGITKRFGDFYALRGIDLTVRCGEVLGFLGPNGAGKTTTLRIITGLLQPSSGNVAVCGIDTRRDPLEAKRRIGFISDRPYLYDKLTGEEFLRFVGGLWGLSPRDIRERGSYWLERFDLGAWGGEPVDAYSHGMRQRLLLSSALLHEPELLIMDEPMVGLDPRGAAQLKQVVRELAQERGMAVVLSTHTLDVVEQICDTAAIIHRGALVASGTLEAIRRAHQVEVGQLEALFLRLTGQAGEAKHDG
jgi:ABC-2 type transport system ATP-binding protein